MRREEVIQKLLEENKEFRYHYEKHHELDATIDKLEKHHPMTHELEMEIERLKRERLYHKDIMEYMINEHMKAHT
ncbi:MAG: YdcH family protein [Aquificaceae bacterium]|nr:YdcH family protein [Aquificaceae bacterium]MCX8163861.1 YdcH family protein [Aquificaceae bacterium]